jgi:23S rRNA pseudouridine1911/1915/1917 synthase
MSVTITGEHAKTRIDAFLHKHPAFSHISKGQIARTIEAQKQPTPDALFTVHVNSELVVKPIHKLRMGDVLTYTIKAPQKAEELSSVVKPENIPIEIIHSDDHVVVVNKTKDMVIHPSSSRNTSGTLVNALLFHFPQGLSNPQEEVKNGDEHFRPGIVHRLDKDTSGTMVIARTNEAHEHLKQQFMTKDKLLTKRTYTALVEGDINSKSIMQTRGSSDDESNAICVYIGRHPTVPSKRMAYWNNQLDAHAKHAVTRFEVKERFESKKYGTKFTLVELTLETGRTHQIRVSLAHINRPLVGDEMYNPRYVKKKGKKEELLTTDTKTSGQFLHASLLGFVHPGTNKYVEFKSELPEYFTNFLNKLREESKL